MDDKNEIAKYYEASASYSAVTQDNIAELVWNPERWMYLATVKDAIEPPSKSAELDMLAHEMLLGGPEAFAAKYLVADGPVNPKTGMPYGTGTKAYAEWLASVGRPVVCKDQFDILKSMNEVFMKNAGPVDYKAARRVIHAKLSNTQVMCVADIENGGAIIDLKTTSDLCDFRGTANRMGYLYQAAMLHLVSGGKPVELLVVEKSYPSRCTRVAISEKTMSDSCEMVMESIAALERGVATGEWISPVLRNIGTL